MNGAGGVLDGSMHTNLGCGRNVLPGWINLDRVPLYWRADYGYRGDWAVERIVLLVPRSRAGERSAGEVMEMVRHERNVVAEMYAELRAVKPIRPPRRELQQAPPVMIELVDL